MLLLSKWPTSNTPLKAGSYSPIGHFTFGPRFTSVSGLTDPYVYFSGYKGGRVATVVKTGAVSSAYLSAKTATLVGFYAYFDKICSPPSSVLLRLATRAVLL